jgi:uncharacterized membrane protein
LVLRKADPQLFVLGGKPVMVARCTVALLLVLCCLIPALAVSQVYKVTDLGPLAPTAINDFDQVVGDYNGTAYMWTPWTGMTKLGILQGGTFSHAAAINDLGAVSGIADGPYTIVAPPQFGFPNEPCNDLTQPFVWTRRGGMQGLGSIIGSLDSSIFSYESWCETPFLAQSINIHGQVTGYCSAYSTFQWGFVWTMTNGMSAFGGGWVPTFVNQISDAGTMVGQNSQGTTTPYTFFIGNATLWNEGVATDLGTLGDAADAYSSSANGINDQGQVVGWSTTAPLTFFTDFGWTGEVPIHAVLWSASGAIGDLGTLPGDTFSAAWKINLLGEVIGTSGNTVVAPTTDDPRYEITGRPFIWSKPYGMLDLNKLIPENSGWVLNSASGINILGQIVGQGTLNGEPHGFLLTPKIF